ncbi:Na/Pi cotransporter family protein [Pelagicoccus sp. SDUM812003]|uniref:Na/Pi cotransporter family protein n=1 Tax=Pelagicoccus sp. SDUM812003 TaxID=3041267 RepID=UPI00281022A8|nr:Na/Pi cotransporter family protein [Pelagicoccus sp. SDUM812003]MDQ8202424.1 Na/Pi cotransporter family protein [Pelagicoccus sp. SDUM812003]
MYDTFLLLAQVLGSLGIFIFGMKLMSESILKLSGERLRSIMSSMTTNRFAGVLTGLFITSLVQSSSATTVMVVSFVHAQLLNLTQAIGVIMGANLGTTITAWIVSAGFKFSLGSVSIPIIGVGVALSFLKGSKFRNFGNFLTGFGLLFLGLSELKGSVPDVKGNTEMLQWIASFSEYGFFSIIIFIVIGTLLTVIVQSSSAAMAITLTMASLGWLNFEQSAAIILGENIGTTITAYLAAIPANVAAKRAARAHLTFNLIGVTWMLVLINPFSNFVLWVYGSVSDALPGLILKDSALTTQLALFHTLFNLFNICLLIGFVPFIAKLVTRMVKDRPSSEHQTTFRYLRAITLGTGELNFEEATRATERLGRLTQQMFRKFIEVYENPDKDMSSQVKELDKLEKESNDLTNELTEYLIRCTSDEVSEETRQRAYSYLRVAAELEEIGDCCHRMTSRAVRRYKKKRLVTEVAEKEVIQFGKLVERFIELYSSKLSKEVSASDMEMTIDFEKAINEKRKELRKRSVNRMMDSADNVKPELLYIDIVNTFERIANHARNIMQSLPKADT